MGWRGEFLSDQYLAQLNGMKRRVLFRSANVRHTFWFFFFIENRILSQLRRFKIKNLQALVFALCWEQIGATIQTGRIIINLWCRNNYILYRRKISGTYSGGVLGARPPPSGQDTKLKICIAILCYNFSVIQFVCNLMKILICQQFWKYLYKISFLLSLCRILYALKIIHKRRITSFYR